ncbi:MAG: STAS domain-containing protein [Deltaproteobacteria bacterium]|nr:STAS domain-containing protein [Deltaproteobacteria bacterium]MBW2019178.1 STAS domain-containing protein [Deltaproteobacteria bacterium]MBW2073981.1 STAS domain-containing protein [Deltaproteobacteria bacterium]
MVAKNFSVTQDEHGIYHLRGELSIHELDDLKDFLEGSLKAGQDIAISLSKVRFIDTAALQLLIAFKRRLAPQVRLQISEVSAEVENILTLCGLKTALI